jgi:hypothetical protein
MKSGEWLTINPYQTPAEAPPPHADFDLTCELRSKLASFRRQIHALGGTWIVLGVILLMFVPTISLHASPSRDSFGNVRQGDVRSAIAGGIAATLAVGLIFAGIGTCWKSRRAVYAGIVISCFALLEY